MRPEARIVLEGCDAIIHAGDIGQPEVLEELRQIAPLTAIRGNVDKWACDMADTAIVAVDGRRIYILHDLKALNIDPKRAGFDVVVSGHSHKPRIAEDDGVLYVNPGSAGPRRFSLPVVLALLTVSSEQLEAQIVNLAT